MFERQELYCHNCNVHVQFDLDLSIDGNHVLECPNCGHEHCRVVKGGVITDERWDQRNGPTVQIPTISITWNTSSVTNSVFYSGSQNVGVTQAWLNTTSTVS